MVEVYNKLLESLKVSRLRMLLLEKWETDALPVLVIIVLNDFFLKGYLRSGFRYTGWFINNKNICSKNLNLFFVKLKYVLQFTFHWNTQYDITWIQKLKTVYSVFSIQNGSIKAIEYDNSKTLKFFLTTLYRVVQF